LTARPGQIVNGRPRHQFLAELSGGLFVISEILPQVCGIEWRGQFLGKKTEADKAFGVHWDYESDLSIL
jgi:hypothetical protein